MIKLLGAVILLLLKAGIKDAMAPTDNTVMKMRMTSLRTNFTG